MPRNRNVLPPVSSRAPAHARVKELNFDDDRRIPPRAGEPLRRSRVQESQPPSRARRAGLTGGSVDDDTTGDDLSPTTLLDPQGVDSPLAGGTLPADQTLRRISERELVEIDGMARSGEGRVRRRR